MTPDSVQPKITFPELNSASLPYAVSAFSHAAYTLFVTPEHEKLHQRMENDAAYGPHQPLQAPITATTSQVYKEIFQKAELSRPEPVDAARLTLMGGVLVQFTDYVPRLQQRVTVPYANISGLHDAITTKASETGPLGFAEQLGVALEYTNGNLVDSLWKLVLTSRLYARWLDSKIIPDMPNFTTPQKLDLMKQYRQAITACKEPHLGQAQDPIGDNYYSWTHALAKVAYTHGPVYETRTSRTAVALFHRGTNLMHRVVHTFNKQGVASDHAVAAAYGNAIGQACVDSIAIVNTFPRQRT